ncbi:hypothetical protein SORBI_3001G122600 [Sorghum bicolor]|uniref:F-box domain-containing protein n=1 Tax=Sorghum bicolor TaxID=4558 RepID=A0A1B6QIL8_SORBI|nr:hypothetical protein SORBI_3001G122600 [Sorghum bicolor]
MAPPLPSLPTDCLLHVFLRLDPISIARCAAVSKHWHRAVIDNAYDIRRCLAGHADSCLLLGLHYREMFPGELGFSHRSSWLPSAGRHWSDDLPVPCSMPVAEGTKTKLYAPLACSDGLLLVCRGLPSQISVVNSLTGFHASVPRPSGELRYRYLLHSCHGTDLLEPRPNSFQTGEWSQVFQPEAEGFRCSCGAAPLVCQGAVHWLCKKVSGYGQEEFVVDRTIAVDIATGRARMTRLPEHCSMFDQDVSIGKKLMLATYEGDRLSLLRREEASLEVSVWLYVGDHGGGGGDDPERSWLLRQSINIRKLIEDAGLSRFRLRCKDWSVLEIRLEWFCPRSRCVIMWIPYLGLLVLDLASKQIRRATGDSHGHIWPYEIDLTLCLSSIKMF